MTENTDAQIEVRLLSIENKLDELEDYLAKATVDIEEIRAQIDHLEASFLDEIAQSAKTKFDNFRDYLASKIKP